jgi:hypothetical protein
MKSNGYDKMPAPEVGYGRPFQWETSRVLAGDLRFFLCGNASTCPHIQADEWTIAKFLEHFFDSPGALFAKAGNDSVGRTQNSLSFKNIMENHVQNITQQYPMDMAEYESFLWEQNAWVLCLENQSNCSGSIPKHQWLQDRVGQCSAKVLSFLNANPEALSMNVDLCNINGQMDSLCKEMLDSVLRITNLNCILSGNDVCLEKSYFYTPSVFSSSNQQFVRDTVRQFYQRFDSSICAADSKTQSLIQQNSILNAKCAAVPLQALKISLEGARSVVDIYMNILFDILMIAMDLMQLLMASAEMSQQITQDLFYWFQKLVIDAAESLKQIGNVLYKALLENSPLGTSFREAVQTICSIVEWIMNFVWSKFLCYVVEVTVPIVTPILIALLEFVDAIVNIINSIACAFNSCLPNSDIIADLIKAVNNFQTWVLQNLQCGTVYSFNCYPNQTQTAMTAALPVATRCWSAFQPDASDASSILSCTRSDTCWNEETQKQILCDACPLQAGEDFLQFACSPLTKRCTCGVQRFERTQCSTHEQCYAGIQDASCMRMASVLSTNAYSTVPCKQCPSQPLCIVTSRTQPGKLSCCMHIQILVHGYTL